MEALILLPVLILLVGVALKAGPSPFVTTTRRKLEGHVEETDSLRQQLARQEQADERKVSQYAAALEETAQPCADKPKEEREALRAIIKHHRMNRNA